MATREHSMSTVKGQARSNACSIKQKDWFAKSLGLELMEVGAGHARMRAYVSSQFLNGHEICHGGFIFTLADTAFAHACNSYEGTCVTAGSSIEFLQPAREGDILVADASEQMRGARSGVYDVRITNGDGRLIALFRGKSVRIRNKLTADEEAAVPQPVGTRVE